MASADKVHVEDLSDGYRDPQEFEPGGPGANTGAPFAPPAPLGGWQLLRFCWRQLTSMRTALFLLMLLAIASVPGSTFPQENIDPAAVAQYLDDHRTVGPWLRRLQVFHVYSSVWFSAIYILLFISLIGCVLPRVKVHWRALRSRPPRIPVRLSRLPEHRAGQVAVPAEEVLKAAAAVMRQRRFRVDLHHDRRHEQDSRQGGSVCAERGYHRESGNLLFHLSLIGLLVAIAAGSLLSFSGQRLVVVGGTFTGAASSFDSFTAGAWSSPRAIPPFSLTLESMDVAFEARQTSQIGQPRQFAANVTLAELPTDVGQPETIQVNHPADINGTQISLSGNGYAPVLTFRDGAGNLVHEGPVPFLPQSGNYDSTGVVKIPDAVDATGRPVQVGLQGVFLPSATVNAAGNPVSGFPDLANPVLVMAAYTGDLRLDDGVPQSVYELDDSDLTQVLDTSGRPYALQMRPGETVQLPDGLGSLTFEAVERFAAFDVRYTPGQLPALVFSLLATAGLIASLFLPRRRLWIRVTSTPDGVHSRVEVGGLSRGNDAGLADEVDLVLQRLSSHGQTPAHDCPTSPPEEPQERSRPARQG